MDNHDVHELNEAEVCYTVGIIFVVIVALLILLGIMN